MKICLANLRHPRMGPSPACEFLGTIFQKAGWSWTKFGDVSQLRLILKNKILMLLPSYWQKTWWLCGGLQTQTRLAVDHEHMWDCGCCTGSVTPGSSPDTQRGSFEPNTLPLISCFYATKAFTVTRTSQYNYKWCWNPSPGALFPLPFQSLR